MSGTLWGAVDDLLKWQTENKGKTGGRCLEAVRYALGTQGFHLPASNVDYTGEFAICCGEVLWADNAKWRWASYPSLPHDLQPSLVFFRNCGKLTSGKYKGQWAGHVAIYKPSTGIHIANVKYAMSDWWKSRIAYIFRPLP